MASIRSHRRKMVFGRGMRREATGSVRSKTTTSLVRGLAAVALCMSGAVITGLATTATPAGAANPTPLIYEIDNTANAINVFPATASGNVAPTVHITANGSSLNDPLGGVFDSAGDLWVANENWGTPLPSSPRANWHPPAAPFRRLSSPILTVPPASPSIRTEICGPPPSSVGSRSSRPVSLLSLERPDPSGHDLEARASTTAHWASPSTELATCGLRPST